MCSYVNTLYTTCLPHGASIMASITHDADYPAWPEQIQQAGQHFNCCGSEGDHDALATYPSRCKLHAAASKPPATQADCNQQLLTISSTQ